MSFIQMEAVQRFANSIGMKADLLMMVVFMFFPLLTAPMYRRLNNATMRHWFDVIVGTFVLVGLYGWQSSVHFFVLCAVSLAVTAFGGPNAPKLVSIISFGYLGMRHIARYMNSDHQSRQVDITGPMMMLVLKVISFSFTEASKALKPATSMVEIWGYFLHHSTLVVGPIIKLNEYKTYTALKDTDVPPSFAPAMIKLAQSLFYFAIYLPFGLFSEVTFAKCSDSAFMSQKSFLESVFFCYFHIVVIRTQFYAAWTLSESCLTLSGWGYNQENKNWELLCNVRPLEVEFGQNPRQTINNWNIRVSEWLREYVMEKFSDRNLGTLLAFCVSALWHGFSLTQYTMFVCMGVYLLVVAKTFRRAFHPIASSVWGGRLKPVYDIVGIPFQIVTLSFLAMPFMTETVDEMWACWKNDYMIGFVLCAIAYGSAQLVLMFAPKQRKTQNAEKSD
eukprot:c11282_g1_i3.p1 GENE.c11282_g1_i3~~c11282_g1_i3.p1  ORF type:complete len:447 (+),score=108.01 c11282_g1_i3:84-1424(+)